MGKPIFLLGAGASMDAGLFDTHRLTREIYNRLQHDAYKIPAHIFGYVISKVISKKTRAGHSPFSDVNVEEVYDGVEKLLYRDRDILSEFVNSWDPFLDSLAPTFDEGRFVSSISRGLSMRSGRGLSNSPLIDIDQNRLRDAAREITKATSGASGNIADILPYLIDALVQCLTHKDGAIDYMQSICEFASEKGGVIGSLNYDTVVESALNNIGASYDYGLSNWNSRKIASFSGSRSDIRLIKIHGSMNWFGDDDKIDIDPPLEARINRRKRLMIFGGANSKLRPDGPFLQLRHEFEKSLLSTNLLIIIGYAFADGHLNAIIRRWVSTRRKAKLIIVDPGYVNFGSGAIGSPYKVVKDQITERTVDIIHIQKGAAAAVTDIIHHANAPIDLTIPKRDGLLPHIYVNAIS